MSEVKIHRKLLRDMLMSSELFAIIGSDALKSRYPLEQFNEGLVGGHAWKIFPLLHRRSLFAESDNFLLYDFYTPESHVNEDVFAYSNKHDDPHNAGASERGLVLYHNKFAETSGWIKVSAAYVDKASGDLRQRSLAEGLDLPYEGYVIFKDYVTHLEYIRLCSELWDHGLFVQLGAYQHHAFLDWKIIAWDEKWSEIHLALNGAGVESVQGKWEEMFGVKEAAADEKVKKPAKKRATKKKANGEKKTTSKTTKTKKKSA